MATSTPKLVKSSKPPKSPKSPGVRVSPSPTPSTPPILSISSTLTQRSISPQNREKTSEISLIMNRLFGSKSTAPKPSLNDAISSIDDRVGSLDVKLAKLNAELSTYQQKLGRMREGPGKSALKQKALKVLRQRKQIEAQKDQLESQSWNMTQASMTTDNLKNTVITMDAMKSANKALKASYGKIDIDKIEQLQDEMLDLIDKSNELQESLSMSYDAPDDISESELDAELDALGDEMQFEAELDASGLGTPSYLATDSVPDKLPAFIDEEEEQAQLAN
ncbi:hypothetical protein JCM33374_g1899 [Metschnikowia sp. JCM 33374]|nr:hypothetical protein JCM33374_g1899 [Metschnikowia sp. JCM 33374]